MSIPAPLAHSGLPFALLIVFSSAGLVHAAASEAYRDCLLERVKPAKSALAAQYLQQACARRFPDARSGTDLTVRPDAEDALLAYDHCLFKQLATVQNDQSAQWMEQFCHDQHHPGTRGQADGDKPVPILNLLNILVGSPQKKPVQDAPNIDGEQFVPLQPAPAGR
ncbi:MAG: hypothetical protein H7834_13970 [Magnetococcus sp. YQC-9]